MYPVSIFLTESITKVIILNYHDLFLIVIISGIISGISNGITYRFGFASGGLGVLAPILSKYFKVSISTTNFVINSIIVLFGGYYYGFNMVLYAIILLYISRYICNPIILGISSNKVIFIQTAKVSDVIDLLINKYHITATILDGYRNDFLLTVVKNSDYLVIKHDLRKIDRNIFFSAENCYEVRK